MQLRQQAGLDSPQHPQVSDQSSTLSLAGPAPEHQNYHEGTHEPAYLAGDRQGETGHFTVDGERGSHFLGATAAAHLLPADDEDCHLVQPASPWHGDPSHERTSFVTFPFHSRLDSWSILEAGSKLPEPTRLRRLIDVYFAETPWRFAPVSRNYFDGVLDLVTSGNSNSSLIQQAAQLAMIFGLISVGCLFDASVPSHSDEAKSYSMLSLHCLGIANFLTHTSTACLVSLHLYCCFLINEDRPRVDEIFAIVGLALRLATIAGFHKDGSRWGLPGAEVDARRRIWWEILTLERINANRFGLSPFIQADVFDASTPADESTDGFLAWRWEWDNILHQLIKVIQEPSSDPSSVQQRDGIVRSYWSRLPNHLKYRQVRDGGRTESLQQIRLALHFNTGLLQCHRSSFQLALRTHSREPMESERAYSVESVIDEACPAIIALVDALYGDYGLIFTRHIVAALDLFSAIVPLAALVMRSPRSTKSVSAHNLLLRGLALLEQAADATPCLWYAVLLTRGKRMAARATSRLASRWTTESRHSSPPVMPQGSEVGVMTYEYSDGGRDDFDFDQWLESIWEPLSTPDQESMFAIFGDTRGQGV
ncbi:fungal-specific transcription factor domain-domain-containing protein [Kockovaella imperatae]|uniref:Fungal-specific transcription factor domain-domain-containing protein n=1 Tax=Kockovaella imperatae TaxID=4999 RepID=A0A1Y1UNB5_9TREE|nr:fungal-specific transcription factor domain-domain-containing protein [Kockovaella imperatae]ORX39541.1 fungal-specific transcription factor domain-domain-containing protein [Kockovaella imperatae]